MHNQRNDYFSFLLRLWRVGQGEQPGWRVLLEQVGTGEQCSFASLEEAFEYLRYSLSGPPAAQNWEDGYRNTND